MYNRKPYRKPSRPSKKSREVFFKQNRKYKNVSSIHTTGQAKTHLPVEDALKAIMKLPEEDRPYATIKCPYGRYYRRWRIEVKRERSDKELSKMYSDHLDKYEQDMATYRERMVEYKEKMEAWKKSEVERIQAQAERQIESIMREV